MKLWLDRRETLEGDKAPGRTHALIIGTSRYRWLPKQGKPKPDPERNTLDLTEVDICATSALMFANWLRDHFQNPDAPLATIQLCLNPSDEEMKTPDMQDLDPEHIGTTREKIMENLQYWQKACANNPAGIAVLYAGGHGIQVPGSKEDALILLEDFAQDQQIFTYSIDIGSNRKAMVGKDMPQTQLYFADACRLPADTKLSGLGVGATLPYNASIPDQRAAAPIYYSALPNMAALGVKQKGTFFMQALIECLNHLALEGPDRKSSLKLEKEKWHVSVSELNRRMDQRVKQLALAKAKELQDKGINVDFPEQGVRMGGETGSAVFHALPTPPMVRLTLDIDPDEVAAQAQAALWPSDRAKQIGENRRCRPKPCEFGEVEAGIYSLDILTDGKQIIKPGVVVLVEPPETVFPYKI